MDSEGPTVCGHAIQSDAGSVTHFLSNFGGRQVCCSCYGSLRAVVEF